jgi:hypothetical protein
LIAKSLLFNLIAKSLKLALFLMTYNRRQIGPIPLPKFPFIFSLRRVIHLNPKILQIFHSYCCYGTPPSTISSATQDLLVLFRSFYRGGRGFQARARAVPGGDGQWSEWGEWTECSANCGACGQRRRSRRCLPDEENGNVGGGQLMPENDGNDDSGRRQTLICLFMCRVLCFFGKGEK